MLSVLHKLLANLFYSIHNLHSMLNYLLLPLNNLCQTLNNLCIMFKQICFKEKLNAETRCKEDFFTARNRKNY